MPRKTLTAAPPTIQIMTSAPAESSPEPKEFEPKEEKEQNWFFTKLCEIPREEWGATWSLELHRLKPDVPGVPGRKGYLRIFNEPVTLETIRTNFGGGRFRLNLCRNGRWNTSHEFEIEGQPKYDTSMEMPSGGNGTSAVSGDMQKEFLAMLKEELNRSRESNQGQLAGSDQVVEMLTKASDKAMEMVTRRVPETGNPTSQLREMIGALKDMGIIGAQQVQQKTLIEQIVELVSHPLLGPKILELFAPKNPLDQLTQVNAILDLATKIRGDGGDGEPKDWKAMGVKLISERLPEILDVLKTNADSTAAAAQARAVEAQNRARTAEALRGMPPQPGAPAAPPPVRVTNNGLRLVPTDSPEPPAAVPAAGLEAAAAPTTQEEFDTAMKVQVVNMMRLGASGAAIAGLLEDIKPELAKDLLHYDEAVITTFFSQDPILKLMVEDPRWPKVLTQAREYLAEDVDDEEDEPEPTPLKN